MFEQIGTVIIVIVVLVVGAGLGLLQLLAFDASSHLLTLMAPQHEAGEEAKPCTNH